MVLLSKVVKACVIEAIRRGMKAKTAEKIAALPPNLYLCTVKKRYDTINGA